LKIWRFCWIFVYHSNYNCLYTWWLCWLCTENNYSLNTIATHTS